MRSPFQVERGVKKTKPRILPTFGLEFLLRAIQIIRGLDRVPAVTGLAALKRKRSGPVEHLVVVVVEEEAVVAAAEESEVVMSAALLGVIRDLVWIPGV